MFSILYDLNPEVVSISQLLFQLQNFLTLYLNVQIYKPISQLFLFLLIIIIVIELLGGTRFGEYAAGCLCLRPCNRLCVTSVCLVVEQMAEQSVIDTVLSYFCRVRMFTILPGFVMHPEINASLLLYG